MFEAIHLLAAEDVGVTSIQDGHGAAAEELTASGTELNLYGYMSAIVIYPPKPRYTASSQG
jgi:hypothetical protein